MKNIINQQNKPDSFGFKFQAAIILLFVLVMAINFFWTYKREKEEIIEIATEKADIIVREYLAAIEFASDNASYRIAQDGTAEVHQSILGLGQASKQFNDILSIFADFKLRMISSKPRNSENTPDVYEQSALSRFELAPSLKKLYKQVKIENKYHLRYLVPLKIKKNCLPCHGEPAGELDPTGYEKEGYKLGEIRGAISLTVPMFTEYKHSIKHFFELIIFYLVITFIAIVLSYIILKRMINLNKEINTKNAQLKEQHDTLKEYEKEKSSLIEMIVHDLKNPLTAVRSGIDIVIMSETISDERLNALLQLSHSGVKRLSDMISDILDISAMENRQFTPKYTKVDISSFMTTLFEEIKLAFMGRVTYIDLNVVGEFPPFYVEQSLLKRVVENIVFNAVKHSPPKHAEITATVDYLDYNDEVLITVSDKGEGIPPDEVEHIFDKFYQVEGGKHSSLNKGLGLTFCKYAVDIMGGKVWVESELYKGTSFFFTIKNNYDDSGEKRET